MKLWCDTETRIGAAFGGASRPVEDAFGDVTDGADADDLA